MDWKPAWKIPWQHIPSLSRLKIKRIGPGSGKKTIHYQSSICHLQPGQRQWSWVIWYVIWYDIILWYMICDFGSHQLRGWQVPLGRLRTLQPTAQSRNRGSWKHGQLNECWGCKLCQVLRSEPTAPTLHMTVVREPLGPRVPPVPIEYDQVSVHQLSQFLPMLRTFVLCTLQTFGKWHLQNPGGICPPRWVRHFKTDLHVVSDVRRNVQHQVQKGLTIGNDIGKTKPEDDW